MKAQLLRIHVSDSAEFGGSRLHEAVVQRCRELGIAGATVLHGLAGYGETADIHTVATVVVVDSTDQINRLLLEIERMIPTGVIAVSEVDAVRVQKKPPPPGRFV